VSGACLNCGATLRGAFCSECGQRAISALPTVKEMLADTWHELSGYDGRFARTFRILLLRPGALTIEILEGRRARYIQPVRLYLMASLVFFVLSAAVPQVRTPPRATMPGTDEEINVADPDAVRALSPEKREQLLQQLDRAPWWADALIRPVFLDPVGFRSRVREMVPRTLFVLVPVFAAIVGLFYWRRRYSQHLVFALHLHAAIFITLAAVTLANLSRSLTLVNIVGVVALLAVFTYALAAFRRVYRDSWLSIVAKSIGILTLYFVATAIGMIVTMIWAGARA
jgi:hypothetical protein